MNHKQTKKYWFVFCKTDLLVEKKENGTYTIPLQDTPPTEVKAWTNIHNITPLENVEVKTYNISSPVVENNHYMMTSLRVSFDILPHDLYIKAGKCAEILYWDTNTKFCGVCGGTMKLHTDISKRCENCGKEVWPQLATAIIVLISKGDEILLVHANNFKGNYYGLIAGFVETGEDLEEAVNREVMEETGLHIKNIRYFKSQPWPYPCGLMIGFFADYVSGNIRLQRSELGSGGWFNKDNMPAIPGKVSLARMLIDEWLKKRSIISAG